MNSEFHLDFTVIGAAKAGTTFLQDAFELHPQIFVPNQKETYFFALEGSRKMFAGPGDERMNSIAVRSYQDFLEKFDGRQMGQVCGECCPLYLYSEQAIRNIARRFPRTKIIILLREPVQRAFSTYSYLAMQGRERLGFYDALMAEDDRIAAGYQHIWHYRNMGHYERTLPLIRDLFPAEQIFVDVYRRDLFTQEFFKRLYDFMEVPPVDSDSMKVVNFSGVPRSRILGRLVYQDWRGKNFLKRLLPEVVRRGIRRGGVRRGKMDARAREFLRRSYQGTESYLIDEWGIQF